MMVNKPSFSRFDSSTIIFFVLMVQEIYCLHTSSKNFCQKMSCDDKKLTIIQLCYNCYGDVEHLPEVLMKLPTNTTSLRVIVNNFLSGFYYSNSGRAFPLNITNIKCLSNLRELEIVPKYVNNYQEYPVIFTPNMFAGKPIEKLVINLPMLQMDKTTLSNATAHMNNLQYLDFANTRGLGFDTMKFVLTNLQGKPINVIKLSKVQMIGTRNYFPVLTLSDIVQPGGNFSTVEVLDISSNGLTTLATGLTLIFPNLKVFDASFNLLTGVNNLQTLVEVAMHPLIIELYVHNQGCIRETKGLTFNNENDFSKDKTDKTNHQTVINFSTDLQNKDDTTSNIIEDSVSISNDDIHLQVNDTIPILWINMVRCVNKYSNGNVSLLFQDGNIVCHALRCIYHSLLSNIPCKLWQPLKNWFDPQSSLYVKIPIGRNIKVIHFSNQGLENHLYGHPFTGNLVFNENNIRSIFFGNNSRWLQSFHASDSLEHTHFVGLYKLQYLNLENCGIEFNPQLLIKSFTGLKKLNLQGNVLHFSSESRLCDINTTTEDVNLMNSNITIIPQNLFDGCSRLKNISLIGNHLKDININLHELENLQWFDVAKNEIKILNERFRNQLDNSGGLLLINLLDNPLSCECNAESSNFIKWLLSTNVTYRKEEYVCYGSSGTMFIRNLKYEDYIHRCFPSNLIIIVVTTAIAVSCIAFLALIVFLYRIRWRLRYLIFRFQEKISYNKLAKPEEKVDWEYDAFVSYCAEDRFWTHGVLMKALENEYGFHLCIHYRDFPVGDLIVDAIMEKISASREVILIVTDNFMDSDWCRFEIEVAHRMLLARNKTFILIKMGDLTKSHQVPSLPYMLDTQNFLEWPENEEGQKLFWAKLVSAMYNQTESGCLPCLSSSRSQFGYRQVQGFADVEST